MGNFTKPSVIEIAAYCLERKNGIDAEQFYAHYESNGWKVGRNPMKSWRFAVITWEKNRCAGSGGSQNKGAETKTDRPTRDEWAKWKEEQAKARREGKMASKEDLQVIIDAYKKVIAIFNQRSLMFQGRANGRAGSKGNGERAKAHGAAG